jgi:transcriptional regulator with XRE-family HTH domain
MTAPPPATQRRALADFLRAHRGRLAPDEVGLPKGARRRTPGLRREEVAQLSGISATWYAWLEQGRDVSASSEALARLARTLKLAAAERAYFFELAGRRDPSAEVGGARGGAVPTALDAALAAMAIPAYLLDRTWTPRAWNKPAQRLFTGWLGTAGDKNLLRYVFLDLSARRFIADWEDRARRVLAEFRIDHARHLEDPALRGLVDDLRARSRDFARLWEEQAVTAREGGERRFDHPEDGPLHYEQISLNVASQPDWKLHLLTPCSAAAPTLPATVPLES